MLIRCEYISSANSFCASDKEVYDRVNEEKSRYWDKDNSSTPYADIFNNSSYLKDLEKEHAKILRAYDAARLD